MILKPVFYYDKESIYSTPYEAWASTNNCNLYYYDDIFDKVNWKIEPTQTLESLYIERARKIRDEYEYVILCYSGGNDSTNILETFYYNNIHIDEIVMVGAFSQDSEDELLDKNHNTDLYRNAFPFLKTLNLPNTKVTVIDYTEIFRDINQFTLIKKYGLDWIKYIGTHKSPHNLFWNDFRKFVGSDNKKNTAWIMGIEKVNIDYWYETTNKPSDPYSYINVSRPYVYFSDTNINNYGMSHKDENFTRVNFYCDPDPVAIKIQIKQAHILHKLVSISSFQLRKKIIGSRHAKNKLFYSLKNPLVFQSEKSKTSFLSARDKFLFDAKNSDIYEYYISALSADQSYVKTQSVQKWDYNTRPYFIT
jgi:hypothetical protein